MTFQIKNPSNYNITEMEPYIRGMYEYFDQKLGFHKPPVMVFDSDPSNQSDVLGKTAYYDPSALEIHIFTDGRHPKDMLRSIAHELIHHQQNLEGRLDVGGYMGEGYYLKNEKMKALELEAMKNGNGLMREYEDTLKFEEKNEMSLKEWKNNELNQLLMKKFGILKEGVSKYDPEKHGKASEGPGDLRVADMKTPDNKEDDKLVKEEQQVLRISPREYGSISAELDGEYIGIGEMVLSLFKEAIYDIFKSDDGIDEEEMERLNAVHGRFKNSDDTGGMADFDNDVFSDYYNVDENKVVEKYAELKNYRIQKDEDIKESSCGSHRKNEEKIEEVDEVEEGRKSARSTDKDRFAGHEDRYQNVREELDAIANLQETIRKIKEAKKVFFKGKRIK